MRDYAQEFVDAANHLAEAYREKASQRVKRQRRELYIEALKRLVEVYGGIYE